MKRPINIPSIHAKAVKYGRTKPGFKNSANRLAYADKSVIDTHCQSYIDRLKSSAWNLSDAEITDYLATVLWVDWLTIELKNQET